MLAVLSPAKTLDFGPLPQQVDATLPQFAPEAEQLARTCRRISRRRLRAMMEISPKLAELTFQRFQGFDSDPAPRGAKPAIFAYKGDTYLGLDAASLAADDLAYAQDHLRILSGLYGVLRPFDRIQPHRLEMHVRVATRRGANLYAFWQDTIANQLNELEQDTIVNLASVEYWKAAQEDRLKATVVTPVFHEVKDGIARPQSLFLKRARGAMARFMVVSRLDEPAQLRDFTTSGYRFVPDLSTPERPVFHRDRP